MPRLNWITDYVRIDKETMQEVHITDDGEMRMTGEIIKYCFVGKHWVSRNDYLDYCWFGYHENAKSICLPKGKGREGKGLTQSLKL